MPMRSAFKAYTPFQTLTDVICCISLGNSLRNLAPPILSYQAVILPLDQVYDSSVIDTLVSQ